MGSWVAENTAVALVLAAIAALVSRFVARKRPAVAHALWVLVLLRLVAPPIGIEGFPPAAAREWVAGLGERANDAVATAVEPVRRAVEALPIETSERAPSRPFATASARPAARPAISRTTGFAGDVADSTPLAIPARPLPRGPVPLAFPVGTALLAVWAAGTAFALLRLAIRTARFRRLVAAAAPAPVELDSAIAGVAARLGLAPIPARFSARVDSPCVFAFGRPVLVWPAADATFDRGIIAHELAHLRRKDHLVAWIEAAAGALLWWHPLVHLAGREVRRHAELACDAWAVAIAPECRRAYAAALLGVAERLSSQGRRKSRSETVAPALGAFDARYRDLERRLEMILRESAFCRVTPILGAAIVVATVVSLPSWISGAPGDGAGRPRVRVAEYNPEFDRPVHQLVLEETGGGRIVTGAVDERIRSIPGYRATSAMGFEGESANWDDDEDGESSCCGEDEEDEKGECEPCPGDEAESFSIDVDPNEDEPTEAGITLLRRGDYPRAIRAFARDVENGNVQNGLYNIACCYSLAGDQDKAVEFLRRAVDAGYSNIDWMLRDDDLAALRGDGRLAEIGRVASDRSVLAGFGAESWEQLSRRSEETVRSNPSDGGAWLRAGWARLRTGDPAGAFEAFERQVECGYSPTIGHYNLACAAAMMGERDGAFEQLEKAFAGGFSQLHHARNDADLVPLHGDARWDSFIAKMRQRYGDCECDRPAAPAPKPAPKKKRSEVI